jgi:chromosome segregation ATPase
LEKEKAQVIKEKDGISLQLQKLDEDKKKADKTIEKLKNEIARNEKESNEKITTLLQKLEINKEESNRFIAELRQELADKARESDAEISDLLQKMESGKEEAHRSMADLKQTLAQKEEENRRGMASLSEKMEYERVIARKTIQDLNDLVALKEESRTKMAALIQKLESESKQSIVTISSLREGLEQMQKEHDVYARKAEYMQVELQEKIHQYSAHAADLFRAINSDMSGLFVVIKKKKVAIPGICKVVYRWKEDYCVGKRALDR